MTLKFFFVFNVNYLFQRIAINDFRIKISYYEINTILRNGKMKKKMNKNIWEFYIENTNKGLNIYKPCIHFSLVEERENKK